MAFGLKPSQNRVINRKLTRSFAGYEVVQKPIMFLVFYLNVPDLVGKGSVDRCAAYVKAFGNCGGTEALFDTQVSHEFGID